MLNYMWGFWPFSALFKFSAYYNPFALGPSSWSERPQPSTQLADDHIERTIELLVRI